MICRAAHFADTFTFFVCGFAIFAEDFLEDVLEVPEVEGLFWLSVSPAGSGAEVRGPAEDSEVTVVVVVSAV